MDVENTFKDIKSKFGLEEEKHHSSSGNFYTSVCKDKSDNRLMVKILAKDVAELRNKFLSEIYTHNYFPENTTNILFPKLIHSNTESKPEWMIEEHITGNISGNWYEFFDLTNNQINNLVELAIKISQISIPQEKKILFSDKMSDALTYLYHLEKSKYASRLISKQTLIDTFNSTKAKIESLDSNKVFIHGDLTPSNIMFNENSKIVAIDWYESGYGYFGYDLAFLWLTLWNKSEEQNSLEITVKSKCSVLEYNLYKLHKILLAPKMALVFSNLLQNLDDIKVSQSLNEKQLKEKSVFEHGLKFHLNLLS